MADVQYIIGSTDLESAGVRRIEEVAGGHITAPLRGDLLQYPGRDGAVDVEQSFDTNLISLGLVVWGPSRQQFNDNYRTLKRLLNIGDTVPLQRVLSFTTGSETHQATAKFDGSLEPVQINPGVFRMVVRYRLLDGVWYALNPTTRSVAAGSASYSISGDARTRRMTITLTGGTSPVLSNATNGHSLTFTGAMGSPVTIDTFAGTATQSSTDVSQYLTWKRLGVFALESGTNFLAVTGGGTASIDYYPAYL